MAQGKNAVRTLLNGRRLVLYASIAGQVAALIRNVVVARYLGPTEFGIAAIIILTIAFLDSFSNAGTHNLLVQAKEDEDGELLGAANAISVWRGVMTTILLVAVVAPLTHFIDVGLSAGSICLVALASFIGGFTHRGMKSVQRGGNFAPESITQLVGDLGSLAVAIPVAIMTQSHISIIAGLIARSALVLVMSHLMVRVPYRLSWSRAHLRRFWDFGWPLLVNGPLLFFSAQADRIFVSAELGATALGVYSAVLVLVMSPSTAILRWLGTVNMPVLSRVFHDTGDLRVQGAVYKYSAMMFLLGWAMFCGFAYFGTTAISILYGSKYETAPVLVGLIGLLQIIRFLRAWPSTMALSVAGSGGILVSTIIRLMALPVAYLGLLYFGGLPGLIGGFVVGELFALLVSLYIVNRKANRGAGTGFAAVGAFVALACTVIWSVTWPSLTFAQACLAFGAFMAVGVPVLVFSTSPQQTMYLVRRALVRGRARWP